MRRRPGRGLALLLIVAACGAEPEVGEDPAPDSLEREDPPPVQTAELPPHPEPETGRLVTRSIGPYELGGRWTARASVCNEPAFVELLAQENGFGTIVLVVLPPTDRRTIRYPVVFGQDSFPPPPAARVAAQRIEEPEAVAFQALHGEVQLDELGSVVTGRFAVMLREVGSGDSVGYAGAFERIPVDTLPETQCARAEAVAVRGSRLTPGRQARRHPLD